MPVLTLIEKGSIAISQHQMVSMSVASLGWTTGTRLVIEMFPLETSHGFLPILNHRDVGSEELRGKPHECTANYANVAVVDLSRIFIRFRKESVMPPYLCGQFLGEK